MKIGAIVGAIVGGIIAAICALPFLGWGFVGAPVAGPTVGMYVGFAVGLGVVALVGALTGAFVGLGIGWTLQRARFGRLIFGAFVGTIIGVVGALAFEVFVNVVLPDFDLDYKVVMETVAICGGFGIGAIVVAVRAPSRIDKP